MSNERLYSDRDHDRDPNKQIGYFSSVPSVIRRAGADTPLSVWFDVRRHITLDVNSSTDDDDHLKGWWRWDDDESPSTSLDPSTFARGRPGRGARAKATFPPLVIQSDLSD